MNKHAISSGLNLEIDIPVFEDEGTNIIDYTTQQLSVEKAEYLLSQLVLIVRTDRRSENPQLEIISDLLAEFDL